MVVREASPLCIPKYAPASVWAIKKRSVIFPKQTLGYLWTLLQSTFTIDIAEKPSN
jgi:hypothetical protein